MSLSSSSVPSPPSYNPFEGPNENPEAELPLTAGEYIYIYGNMDEDGFFEGRRVHSVRSPLFFFFRASPTAYGSSQARG